jgi:hypothetical protein
MDDRRTVDAGVRTMTVPGLRLRALASRLCSARTLERVVDPLIADLQMEHAEAKQAGDVLKGQWIRLGAGFALLKVIVLCGGRSLLSLEEGTFDEQRAIMRTVTVSTVSMGVVAVLLTAPFLKTLGEAVRAQQVPMFVYLIPQALPLAIPIGFTIGILVGFRGRSVSGRSTRLVLTMAAAWSVMSFAVLAWLMPAANQSFRELAGRAYGITKLAKGINEMTLTELGGQIEWYRGTAMAQPRLWGELTFSYHLRYSLACASAVLALFALAVLARRPVARWAVALAAFGACFAYYALLFIGRSATLSGAVPALAASWLPNAVLVLCAILLKLSERSTDHASDAGTAF